MVLLLMMIMVVVGALLQLAATAVSQQDVLPPPPLPPRRDSQPQWQYHHRRLQGAQSTRTSSSSSSSSSLSALAWTTIPPVEPILGRKKVLVTGAAGFIGSHVADGLLARGDDVIILDEVNDYYDIKLKESNLQLLLDKYGPRRVKIYRGDVSDKVMVTQIFQKERPQWVCHMAARAGVRPSIKDPFIYLQANVQGTARLLDASRKYGVKNFILASSSSVYGGSQSSLFSETENVDRPISPYAASKKACELLSYTYHHLYGINVTALRFFTVYGPRGRPDMAPFMFVDRISRGKSIQQFGDGSSSRDYTYVDDIVNGVLRALDRPYPYQIMNLGKGSGTQLSDFIRLVEKYTGKKAKIQQLPDQPGDVPYTCADVAKAQRLLGYNPSVTLEEGIQRTVEWYQQTYVGANNSNRAQNSSSSLPPGEATPSQLQSIVYMEWLLLCVLILVARFGGTGAFRDGRHRPTHG